MARPSLSTESPLYDDEQEQYRRELEGEADAIRIEIPKPPEVNPVVWKDVEPMLFRGFLVAPASIGDVTVVFKSLNHHEFTFLSFIGGTEGGTPPARFWNTFLSYAVFMFDGENVLSDRDRWLPKLSDVFATLPKGARDRIIRHLSELNRRASNAVRLTEAYVTEVNSRYRWAQLRGMDPTLPAATGVPGTERLGMNWAQLTWRALNYYEDQREDMEREWDNAKFIGSCFAGKGIAKVYAQDTERRKKDKEERIVKKDALLRSVLLGEENVQGSSQQYGATFVVARTVEDLAAEMEKNLRGEKDWHDYIVDQHERASRESTAEQQQRLQAMIDEREREYQGRMLVGGTDLNGLTRAEVEQRLARTKAVESQEAAQRIVYPQSEKEEEFNRKWGLDGNPATQVGMSDKDTQGAVPVQSEPRPAARPFRR